MRTTIAVLAFALAAAGCDDDPPPQPSPSGTVDPVRQAAARTLHAGPAEVTIGVRSGSAAYSVKGTLDVARERFHMRAHVSLAPYTHFSERLELIGTGGESYQLVHRGTGLDDLAPGGCAFDPHAAIGSLGGAASVQESVALVGIAIRLLRGKVGGRGSRYGDERIAVGPQRLVRHLAPVRVAIGADGLIRRLGMELRRFPPPSRGPGIHREPRRERVAVVASLRDFGRRLDLRLPRCVAME